MDFGPLFLLENHGFSKRKSLCFAQGRLQDALTRGALVPAQLTLRVNCGALRAQRLKDALTRGSLASARKD